MLRAYKYRIYPNLEQQQYLAKVFGCVRFIYNKMLADKIEHYKQAGTLLKNTPAPYWIKHIRISSVIRARDSRNSRARKQIVIALQQIIRMARSA
ncbi:Helix-turn-helix domain protein [compost metagenome]